MRMLIAITALGCAAAVAGCATITKGTDDLVTIDTEPDGAQCVLFTDKNQIAVINPTPGSIKVPKSKRDLSVRCEKDGYFPTEGVIAASFQAMTIGNVLFGGLIGVAIDAGSGAMHKYEDGVMITLIPESFSSEDERDGFFDKLRADYLAGYDAAVVKIKETCEAAGTCESQLKDAEASRDIYSRAREPKQIKLYEGAGHSLNSCADELFELAKGWLLETVRGLDESEAR